MPKLKEKLLDYVQKIKTPSRLDIDRQLSYVNFLRKAQQLIKNSLPPSSHYTKGGYGYYEKYYWEHIPKWISVLNKNIEVLDIGAAYGTLAVYAKLLLDAKVTCIDFIDNYAPIELFNNLGIEFKIGNIEVDNFPFENRFDLILLTEVLEHFNFNPIPTLKKLRSYLKKDGVLFLTTPDSKEWGITNKYYKTLDSIPDPIQKKSYLDDHVWQYNCNELLDVISKSGFTILDFEYSRGVRKVGRHFNLTLKPRP